MLKRKKDRIAVEEFCKQIRNSLGKRVKAIKLFGSKVTDRDRPASDIDLFIVVSEKTAEVESLILDKAFEIDLKHDVYISPRIVSASVLKDPVWKITPFIKNIERDGVPV
jgi:predicted nucleotidyltransferase